MTYLILSCFFSKPGIERIYPGCSYVNLVYWPTTYWPFTLTIVPFPFFAISWGLSTGMAPVALIKGPRKVLLHEIAAAMKLIDLLTFAIKSYDNKINYSPINELIIVITIYYDWTGGWNVLFTNYCYISEEQFHRVNGKQLQWVVCERCGHFAINVISILLCFVIKDKDIFYLS